MASLPVIISLMGILPQGNIVPHALRRINSKYPWNFQGVGYYTNNTRKIVLILLLIFFSVCFLPYNNYSKVWRIVVYPLSRCFIYIYTETKCSREELLSVKEWREILKDNANCRFQRRRHFLFSTYCISINKFATYPRLLKINHF